MNEQEATRATHQNPLPPLPPDVPAPPQQSHLVELIPSQLILPSPVALLVLPLQLGLDERARLGDDLRDLGQELKRHGLDGRAERAGGVEGWFMSVVMMVVLGGERGARSGVGLKEEGRDGGREVSRGGGMEVEGSRCDRRWTIR